MSYKVPILSQIVENDSTVYYFKESNNDMLKYSATSNRRRVPSKFVCLNLPRWENLSGAEQQMFLASSDFGSGITVTDPNQLVPALIQNYIENIVGYAKTEDVWDDKVTEFAFWKMLNLLGSFDAELDTDDADGRYHHPSATNSLISYIGNVNVVNHETHNDEEYTGHFIHIPHNAKAVDTPRWITHSDSLVGVSTLPSNGLGTSASLGLDTSTTTFKYAVYDKNESNVATTSYDFNHPQDKLTLDTTNFDTKNEGFRYNAILLYYDVYELTSDNQVINQRTKLGGILFVDQFVQDGTSGNYDIELWNKRLNSTFVTGEAFVHRIDSRFFYGNNMLETQTVVNEYNTTSMEFYQTLMNKVLEMTNVSTKLHDKLLDIETKFSNINQLSLTATKVSELTTSIEEVKTTLGEITGGSNTSTQITTQQLLEAFDTLVNQLTIYNSGNTENSSFTNKFVFSANGAELSPFASFYVHSETGSNNSLIKYAEESFWSNVNYRTYIKDDYTLEATIFDDGGTNKLRFSLNSLNASTLKAYSYNITTLSIDEHEIPASSTLNVSFANTTQTRQKCIMFDTADSTLKVVDIGTLMYSRFLTGILIATFYLPTEGEFNTNDIVLKLPSKLGLNLDNSDFVSENGVIKAFNNMAFTKLKDQPIKLLNNFTITHSPQITNTVLRLSIDFGVTELLSYNGTTTISTFTMDNSTQTVDLTFPTAVSGIGERLIVMDVTDASLTTISPTQFLANGGVAANQCILAKVVLPRFTEYQSAGNATYILPIN